MPLKKETTNPPSAKRTCNLRSAVLSAKNSPTAAATRLSSVCAIVESTDRMKERSDRTKSKRHTQLVYVLYKFLFSINEPKENDCMYNNMQEGCHVRWCLTTLVLHFKHIGHRQPKKLAKFVPHSYVLAYSRPILYCLLVPLVPCNNYAALPRKYLPFTRVVSTWLRELRVRDALAFVAICVVAIIIALGIGMARDSTKVTSITSTFSHHLMDSAGHSFVVFPVGDDDTEVCV